MPDLAYEAIREHPELRPLFHQLNNQLGVVLAHAEMLEAKAHDDVTRARATQVVNSVLLAMGTAKAIRNYTEHADWDSNQHTAA
jgi:hypothetical protein